MEILTWRQLVARLGNPVRARWAVAHGEWIRVLRDAYVWADVEITPDVRMAALRSKLPTDTAWGGRTALWLLGVGKAPGVLEVVVPPGRHLLARPGFRLRSGPMPDAELCRVGGLLVVTAARACIDLMRTESLEDAVVVADRALRAGIVAEGGLEDALTSASGRRGIARARVAYALVNGRGESPMESILRVRFVLAGLAELDVQHDVYDRDGHAGRADLHHDGVLIEFDGRVVHDGPDDVFVLDRQRQNRLADTGLEIRRYTSWDVYRRPAVALVGEIVRASQLASTRDRTRVWSGPDTLRPPRSRPLPTLADLARAA